MPVLIYYFVWLRNIKSGRNLCFFRFLNKFLNYFYSYTFVITISSLNRHQIIYLKNYLHFFVIFFVALIIDRLLNELLTLDIVPLILFTYSLKNISWIAFVLKDETYPTSQKRYLIVCLAES